MTPLKQLPTLIFALLVILSSRCLKCSNVILAKSNACFSSTSYLTDYTFNPPINGEIFGIKLEHKSGSVTCATKYDPTNWGCDSTGTGQWFAIQMIEEGVGTYYPTDTTQGITSFNTLSSCANECEISKYYMSNYGPNDDIIELIDESNTYQVDTSQTFSLQYSESCCGTSTSDNNGTSCVDVYFMYTTEEPTTAAPTTPQPTTPQPTTPQPTTAQPTAEPTIERCGLDIDRYIQRCGLDQEQIIGYKYNKHINNNNTDGGHGDYLLKYVHFLVDVIILIILGWFVYNKLIEKRRGKYSRVDYYSDANDTEKNVINK